VKGPGSQNIPETLPTLGAQETGGRQIKHKSQKDEQHELQFLQQL
jgi:hypothetical protein